MLSRVITGAIFGLNADIIEVETDIGIGRPIFFMVGLPAKEVEESKDRIKSALLNAGYDLPKQRITVNLAPANRRKQGSAYDLPIAIGILIANQQLMCPTEDSIFAGELSLSGELRPIRGALSLAVMTKKMGYSHLFIPAANAPEASLIKNINIYPISDLKQLIDHLQQRVLIKPFAAQSVESEPENYQFDLSDIKGHSTAKRALEIAAAGGHNILFSGPPGSGKTLLARTMPSILPSLTESEIIEVTQIYSIAGLLGSGLSYISRRPFRKPHHTSSSAALVGGGKVPSPGEISLAHRGVLFLDEFPEYSRASLEALRQPLEDGRITVSRVSGTLEFPASFILIAAMNPCPCGYSSDPDKECLCSPFQIINYQKKISGPLLDRIDMHLEVPRLDFDKLNTIGESEKSAIVCQRVKANRHIQIERFAGSSTLTNSEMTAREIDQFCQLDQAGTAIVKNAVNKLNLSPRSYHRLLKISRTIADMDQQKNIQSHHVTECLQYRLRIE